MSKKIQTILSKWTKTKVLITDPAIKTHIPETKQMSKATLESMLNQYGMVYVKPDRGTFGKGVMKVEKRTEGAATKYRYQYENVPRMFDTFDALFASIQNSKFKRSYLVQKGIHLLKHRRRRFDIRVMVQQNPAGKWETTGIIGRLSHPKKIVTNYHSGGTPMAVESLLSSHLSKTDQGEFKQKLGKLGITIAKHMQKRYPGIKEIGVDIGVDRNMAPWILEVNTHPDPYIFRKLKDKSVFRKVYRFAKAYGRVK